MSIIILNPWRLTSCIARFLLAGGGQRAFSHGCDYSSTARWTDKTSRPDQTRPDQITAGEAKAKQSKAVADAS